MVFCDWLLSLSMFSRLIHLSACISISLLFMAKEFSIVYTTFYLSIYQLMDILFFFLIYFLFIYFWLHWIFVAVHGLSLVAASRGYSLLRCAGFSLQWLLLLQSTGSRHGGFSSCGSWALEHSLSSCGART